MAHFGGRLHAALFTDDSPPSPCMRAGSCCACSMPSLGPGARVNRFGWDNPNYTLPVGKVEVAIRRFSQNRL
jgi:hypothetical protein